MTVLGPRPQDRIEIAMEAQTFVSYAPCANLDLQINSGSAEAVCQSGKTTVIRRIAVSLSASWGLNEGLPETP